MINTIFYFEPSKLSYIDNWNAGEISPRTIVFIGGTGEIYKNNVRYGGLTTAELISLIDTEIINNPYDDTSIRNSIAALQTLIDGLNGTITTLISDKELEIKGIVNSVLSEYAWLRKNLGDVFKFQGFVDELDAWLTTKGVITSDSANWASIWTRFNEIDGHVASLLNGLISEAQIKAWINDGVAGIDLNTYALKADLTGLLDATDFETLLDSLLDSKLSGTNSFLQLRSDVNSASAALGSWATTYGSDTVTQLVGLLRTDVDTLSNSVTTSLSSTIRQYLDNELSTAIDSYLQNQAGLILSSNLDGSVASLFSQTSLTKSGVETLINSAGFIAQTDLDTAVATLFASNSNSNSYAAVQAIANASGSSVTITADRIDLNGLVPLLLADSAFISGLNADYVRVGDLANNVTVTTDSIHILNTRSAGAWKKSGAAANQQLGALEFELWISSLYGFDMTTVENNVTSRTIINDGEIIMSNGGNDTLLFCADGSGFLAKGNISWNSSGEIANITLRNGNNNYTDNGHGILSQSLALDTSAVSIDNRSIKLKATSPSIEFIPYVANNDGFVGRPTNIGLASVKSTSAVFDSISIENSTAVAYVSYPSIENDNYATGETGNTPIYSKTVINRNGISFQEKEGSTNWDTKYYYNSNGNIYAEDVTVHGNLDVYYDTSVGRDFEVTGETKLNDDIYLRGPVKPSLQVPNRSTYENFTGISKIVLIGNYYLVFIRGILCYCSTTDPTSLEGPLYQQAFDELDSSLTTLMTVNSGGNEPTPVQEP